MVVVVTDIQPVLTIAAVRIVRHHHQRYHHPIPQVVLPVAVLVEEEVAVNMKVPVRGIVLLADSNNKRCKDAQQSNGKLGMDGGHMHALC